MYKTYVQYSYLPRTRLSSFNTHFSYPIIDGYYVLTMIPDDMKKKYLPT